MVYFVFYFFFSAIFYFFLSFASVYNIAKTTFMLRFARERVIQIFRIIQTTSLVGWDHVITLARVVGGGSDENRSTDRLSSRGTECCFYFYGTHSRTWIIFYSFKVIHPEGIFHPRNIAILGSSLCLNMPLSETDSAECCE